MMTSLLSIFDPSSSFSLISNWSCSLAGLLLLTLSTTIWVSSSSVSWLTDSFKGVIKGNFYSIPMLFTGLMLLILNFNVLGLLPFMFSTTSHLSFNISISLVLWVGVMLWYLKGSLNSFLTHLTPLGCPLALTPFMVLIELISNLIRPLTLALRLMANVLAGHMILTLVSKGVCAMSAFPSMFSLLVLLGFNVFEFGVALIQSYVFSNLMFLYWKESEEH